VAGLSFGKMTEFLDIVETQQSKDAEGFNTSTDRIIASVRAYREDRHGSRVWANRAEFSSATTLFRFRIIPDLAPVSSLYIGLYIVNRGERFKIISAEDVRGRGMYVEILAQRIEGVKSG